MSKPEVKGPDSCPNCGGSGRKLVVGNPDPTCKKCRGTGRPPVKGGARPDLRKEIAAGA